MYALLSCRNTMEVSAVVSAAAAARVPVVSVVVWVVQQRQDVGGIVCDTVA